MPSVKMYDYIATAQIGILEANVAAALAVRWVLC